MPRITAEDVRAWVESSKLDPQALNDDLLMQIEEEVLAQLASVYNTSGWTNETSTPRLVKVIIAKMYAGWFYDRMYSENQSEPNLYAQMLKENAKMLIAGILDRTIEIPDESTVSAEASFYPNDASSAQEPTLDDPSLGPAKFSLGRVF